MKKKYEGLEPCPGCGRSGEQVPRSGKAHLCYDCQQALNIGQALVREKNMDTNFYTCDDLVMAELTWYSIPIKDISSALTDLLRTFSMFRSKWAGYYGENPKDHYLVDDTCGITARDTFVLPRVTMEYAKRLCSLLADACRSLKHDRNTFERETLNKCQEELNAQKDELFNQGVSYGRNLLLQLNNGEISLKQFEQRVYKFSPKPKETEISESHEVCK